MYHKSMTVSLFIRKHILLTSFTIIFLVVFIAVAIILWALSPFYAVGCTTFTNEGYDAFSITFDKQDMMNVNKVEVETPKGISIIEDQVLIKDIVECTLVAKYSGASAVYEHYYIRLYKGDILVRDMDLSLYNKLVRVYYPSKKHFMLYGGADGGQIIISQELLDCIQEYLLAHGNSFGEEDGTYKE